MDRDYLGRCVRLAWVAYCRETSDMKTSHLVSWEELSEWDREADRRIGDAIATIVCMQVAQAIEELAHLGDPGAYNTRIDIADRVLRFAAERRRQEREEGTR